MSKITIKFKDDNTNFSKEIILSEIQLKMLFALEKFDIINRMDFVSMMGMPRTTIYDNLMRMANYGLVMKVGKNEYRRGRPFVFFKLTNRGKRFIDLELNARMKSENDGISRTIKKEE